MDWSYWILEMSSTGHSFDPAVAMLGCRDKANKSSCEYYNDYFNEVNTSR